MPASLPPCEVGSLGLGELATSADPRQWHASLVDKGTHCRDGAWAVSGPCDVAAALAAPTLSVAPPVEPATASGLVARMARFCDGAEHRSRRALVSQMLSQLDDVTVLARSLAADYLPRQTSRLDIMPMARRLPAEVLALAFGLAPDQAGRAATLTGVLCDALAPRLVPRHSPAAADAAAGELQELFAARLATADPEPIAAAIGILFQAGDPTAALIGTTVLSLPVAGPDPFTPGERVEEVLRRHAPVQCTHRTATAATVIGQVTVPPGSVVWVFLATAERGSGMPATFGAGPHACPGATHATAIAREVVTVLTEQDWRPVGGQRVNYERRPNLRLPAQVLVTRR